MARDLTDRQREILDYLCEMDQERGYPPSVREICTRFDIASPNGVQRHLVALERKGFIVRDSMARGIRLHPTMRNAKGATEGVRALPLLGNVAAGPPREALQDVEASIPIPEEWINGVPDAFILRVAGESMAPAIQAGDMVVVRPQARAENGDLVVACIEGEATVKRFHRDHGRVVLIADNPDYDDIPVTDDFLINGKVIGLLRRY
ncbi:MAG TPA: transcriptional repressor LexA [Candidatus Xenobia bacterium]|jgi:repressor LexA